MLQYTIFNFNFIMLILAEYIYITIGRVMLACPEGEGIPDTLNT